MSTTQETPPSLPKDQQPAPTGQPMGRGGGREGGASWGERVRPLGSFLWYLVRRFQTDDGLGTASALAFTTLLAMVPLLAIGLGMLAAYPAFDAVRNEIMQWLFDYLVPTTGTEIQDFFARFVDNAGGLTGAGIVGLAVTSVMLLNTTQRAFGRIWRDSRPAPLLARLPAYWALLTLGPLLFGASLSLSSYVFAMAEWVGGEALGESVKLLAGLTPMLLAVIGFTLLYKLMPTQPVRLQDAAVGGLVAALLFEGGKRAFGLYVSLFPTYEAIYGALAAVPVFFLWVYLSWAIALLGAELAAALPEWRRRRAPFSAVAGAEVSGASGADRSAPARRLHLAVATLAALYQAARARHSLSTEALLAEITDTAQDAAELAWLLARLEQSGLLIRAEDEGWVLLADPDSTSLHEIATLLGLLLGQSGTALASPARASASDPAFPASASASASASDLASPAATTDPVPQHDPGLASFLHQLDQAERHILTSSLREILEKQTDKTGTNPP